MRAWRSSGPKISRKFSPSKASWRRLGNNILALDYLASNLTATTSVSSPRRSAVAHSSLRNRRSGRGWDRLSAPLKKNYTVLLDLGCAAILRRRVIGSWKERRAPGGETGEAMLKAPRFVAVFSVPENKPVVMQTMANTCVCPKTPRPAKRNGAAYSSDLRPKRRASKDLFHSD
jgi:hypothetical protein